MLGARWLQVIRLPQADIAQNASGKHLEQEIDAAMRYTK
jgi:hypothetical protein